MASSPAPSAVESELDDLLARYAPRRATPMERRDLIAEAGLAVAFAAVCVAVAATLDTDRSWSWPAIVAVVLAYGVASRVEFQAGAGYTAPTQLVFVPMLFVAPLELVALLVAAGNVTGHLPAVVRGRLRADKLLLDVNDAWHALGPVAVLAAAGADGPAWADWPVYVAALAAQFAVDFAVAALRERLALGASPAAILRVMGWVWAVDLLMTPTGFLAAWATVEQELAFLLVLPLPVALGVFAGERRRRLAQAIELRQARADADRRELLRREALEINDDVVQHLTVARYLLARGETEQAGELVDRGLAEGRRIIGELLDAPEPGSLRRSEAAG